MAYKLSILIPSTYDRKEMTERLETYLHNQIADPAEVEILVWYDNREMPIGSKRQAMLEAAKGFYVVHVDSDDWVSPDYVKSILRAAETLPDCITFEIKCQGVGAGTKLANVSNTYHDWHEGRGRYKYLRTPYHKTPIKRIIAIQIGFPHVRYAEDYDFSKRLKQSGFIKTEVHINRPLYTYKYKHEDFKTKYGFDKD